ncbi:MAG: DNA polymerase I [Legionellales bacterium]|nr:DNA polymerase I [Legionellales bacterium]
MQRQVVLVDGSGYLFRAFHALPPLTNPEGMPTGAIYGVMNMLRRLDQDYPDAEVVVVFDPPGPTARHDVFPDYKANRGKMPDELSVQIAPLHRLIEAKGYPLCIVPKQEADDVIGTLARLFIEDGATVIICTGDKDFAQLVGDDVVLLDTMRDQLLDSRGVINKFGVRPDQIVDYLALIGDTSDNIPGVMKVGPKTAVKWLDAYGNIDSLIDHADHLSGKVGESFRSTIDALPLYRKLVTICQHVDLPFDWRKLTRGRQDTPFLLSSFKDLGFKTWLKELGGSETALTTAFELINDIEQLKVCCQAIQAGTVVGLSCYEIDSPKDTKPTGDMVALGLSYEGGVLVVPCLPMRDVTHGCEWPDVLSVFASSVFASNQVVLVNAKPFYKHLLFHGMVLPNRLEDITALAYAIKGPNRIGLIDLVGEFSGDPLPDRDDVLGKGAKRPDSGALSGQTLGALLAQEALAQQSLWGILCEKDVDAYRLYDEIDAPLIKSLAQMEHRGVLLDAALLESQSVVMASQIDSLNIQAHSLAGEPFNTASVKQLQTILYDKLGLPVIEKTPKGDPSTSEQVMTTLGETFELPRLILEIRSISKLKSTYVDALPALSYQGRVHCSFQQTVTATGRLSCQNPNLQNIPIRTEAGRSVRKGFIAPDGYQLLSFDYSQIELRIMAHISKDAALVEAFNTGADVHNVTAAELFSMSPEDVGANERRIAKVINFGLIYGMSAFGLAKQLGLDRSTAQAYIDLYFSRYPSVKEYMADTRLQAARDGYVKTVLGRKIHLPDIKHNKVSVRKAAERAAINAPMQGTAAELIKLAMLRVEDVLQSYDDMAYLTIQVHDELIFEVKSQCVDQLIPKIRDAMTQVMSLDVPLIVNASVGNNWGEMKALS